MQVSFEEVLAEPRVNQSLDPIWKFAYVFFAGTKYWVYRGLTAVCALPCGFLWGLIFSLLTLISVWIITPTLRIIDVVLCIIRRVSSHFFFGYFSRNNFNFASLIFFFFQNNVCHFFLKFVLLVVDFIL